MERGVFTPMEGRPRVPFMIRWPGRVPAAANRTRSSTKSTPSPRWRGGPAPTSRRIGRSTAWINATSWTGDRILGAEGFPIFFGEKLYAVKWRNFKVFFVWQVNATN